jgi:hypothetical protein
MECIPGLFSRLIQFPVGGLAQVLNRFSGLLAKLRRRFRYRPQSSHDIPPKLEMVGLFCSN